MNLLCKWLGHWYVHSAFPACPVHLRTCRICGHTEVMIIGGFWKDIHSPQGMQFIRASYNALNL